MLAVARIANITGIPFAAINTKPALIKTQKVPVNIELTGTLTLGMTVADFRFPLDEHCHTQVATELDHSGFWALIIDALQRIGEVEV